MNRWLAFFGLLIVWSLAAVEQSYAAKVKMWHHYQQSHFDKAKFQQAVVSNEGALRLSRQLKPLASLQASHVWDIAEDLRGNLVVATGDEGKLFQVTPEGNATLLYTAADSQVLSLARAADGTIYAGTGPGGKIIAIPPQGKPFLFAKGLDAYVWSLVYDADTKTLYAGTGPKGRIFQIDGAGKASVFYVTKQEHVLCLARGQGQTLYAGTDKGGLVYRLNGQGKGFVLYQASQPEVRRLLVLDGVVYAGTSAPGLRRPPGGRLPSSSSEGTTNPNLFKKPMEPNSSAKPTQSGSSGSGSSSSTGSSATPASAPSSPSSGDNSLYRIAADGTVRELFRDKTMLLSLLKQGGRLLIGTGMQGQLFEIDETTKERSEIARLDHGQILCLWLRRDGTIVMGTGDPGKLYVLEDRFASQGTVVSEVLDAKIPSKWGALNWKADTPPGTAVTLAVRSGNVAEPDETWSDWSAEQSDPQQATILAPTARFLQYRVTLKTTNRSATPALRRLTLRYRTTNQAPEIASLDVPDLDAVNLDNPKKLKIKWSVTDPNEDEVSFNLYYRKEGWKNWVVLEEDYDKKDYDWDTSTVPAGIYRFKVVASDHRDNPAEDALTAQRLSAPVPVAHLPPAVSVKVVRLEGGVVALEASATDPLVRLTEAAFAIDSKKWTNVFPTDGLFDSKAETFRFQAEGLRPGTHVLVVRVRNAAGNVGSADVVFSVPARRQ